MHGLGNGTLAIYLKKEQTLTVMTFNAVHGTTNNPPVLNKRAIQELVDFARKMGMKIK